jgi:hypothetical protein
LLWLPKPLLAKAILCALSAPKSPKGDLSSTQVLKCSSCFGCRSPFRRRQSFVPFQPLNPLMTRLPHQPRGSFSCRCKPNVHSEHASPFEGGRGVVSLVLISATPSDACAIATSSARGRSNASFGVRSPLDDRDPRARQPAFSIFLIH